MELDGAAVKKRLLELGSNQKELAIVIDMHGGKLSEILNLKRIPSDEEGHRIIDGVVVLEQRAVRLDEFVGVEGSDG